MEEILEPSPAGIAAEHDVDIDIPVPVEGEKRPHRGRDGKLRRAGPGDKGPAPEIPPQAKGSVMAGDEIEIAVGVEVGNGGRTGRAGRGQGLGREGTECPHPGRRIEEVLKDDDAPLAVNHEIEIRRRATSGELLCHDLGAGLVGAGAGRGAGALRLVEVEIEIGGGKSYGPLRHVGRGDLVPRSLRAIGGGDPKRGLTRSPAAEHPHFAAPEEEDVGAAVEIEILEKDGPKRARPIGSPHRFARFEARLDPWHLRRLVEPRLGIELRSIPLDHELQRMPLDGPPVGLRLGHENIGQPPQPPGDAGRIAGVGRSHSLVENIADVDVGEGLDRGGEGLHRRPARFDLRR